MHPPKLLRTSSFRLTLIYAGLFLGSAFLLFGVIYWSMIDYMTLQLDSAITDEIGDVEEQWRISGPDRLIAVVTDRMAHEHAEGIFYVLEDPAGTVLAGNMPAMTPGADARTVVVLSEEGNEPHEVRVRGAYLKNGDFLAVGKDASALNEMQDSLVRSFGLILIPAFGLALVGGLVMSRGVLRNIEALSRTTSGILSGDLSHRAPVRGADDEFDHLASGLNAMLDRIQSLMEGMQQVSNDIAHDLRTPLTRLRHHLELAYHKAQTVEELRAALARSTGEVDSILETFIGLLHIAQIESGAQQPAFAPVELSDLLAAVAEVYESTAQEKAQTLSVAIEPKLVVSGHRELLARMLSNLIENAIRHSPDGAAITVRAMQVPDGIDVSIADNGPGIPTAERDLVFRRFYRLERSRTTPGNGLGLSLVAAIAQLHHVAVTLADNRPGLLAALRFPRSAAADSPGAMGVR